MSPPREAGSTDFAGAGLYRLPPELIVHILQYLPGESVVALGATCKSLHNEITHNDHIWQQFCARDLGPFVSPAPYASYRELYKALFAYRWMGVSLWHGSKSMFGTMAVAKYSAESGCLELHQVVPHESTHDAQRNHRHGRVTSAGRTFQFFYVRLATLSESEILEDSDVSSEVIRVAAASKSRSRNSLNTWPPPLVPAIERAIADVRTSSLPGPMAAKLTPVPSPDRWQSKVSEPSSDLFKLRKFINSSTAGAQFAMGDSVEIFSRVPPNLLRRVSLCGFPAPWQGLWVSQDGGTGEFLLLYQHTPSRLEAIKLTGNQRVPAGELAFVVEDLTKPMDESSVELPLFLTDRGLRPVHALTQNASDNYINARFDNSQLVLYSDDMILLYTKEGEFVREFCRVNHDELLAGTLEEAVYK